MTNDVLRMSGAAADRYFEEQKQRLIRHKQGHRWTTCKKSPWLTYCDECGLVWLNNKRTHKEIARGCVFYRLAPTGG